MADTSRATISDFVDRIDYAVKAVGAQLWSGNLLSVMEAVERGATARQAVVRGGALSAGLDDAD